MLQIIIYKNFVWKLKFFLKKKTNIKLMVNSKELL